MTLQEVFSTARELGVQFEVKQDQLSLKGRKGALTSDFLAEIKKHKSEILDLLNKRSLHSEAVLPEIAAGEITGSSELSFAQERLWFIEKMNKGTAQYNICGEHEFEIKLDSTCLRHSLEVLMTRQLSLRTSFREIDGEVGQIVLENYEVPLSFHDFSTLPSSEAKAALLALTEEEKNRPFDLTAGPLLRVRSISMPKGGDRMIFTMHHIVSDGWSNGLFVKELTEIYQAIEANQPVELEPLRVQYTDYARWQRGITDHAALQDQMDYWLAQLDSMPTDHELPFDHPRGEVQPHQGALHRMVFPKNLAEHVYDFCQEHQVTPFIFLQTLYAILIGKLSQKDDVVMGLAVAGRTERDLEPLIGLFVNSLILRSRFQPNESFLQNLSTNKRTLLDANSNQNVPFDLLVEQLNPVRELNKNPMFQLMIIHVAEQSSSIPSEEDESELGKRYPLRTDLDIYIEETADGQISADIVYNDVLWESESIALLASQFEFLVQQAIKQPSLNIAHLTLDRAPDDMFKEALFDHLKSEDQLSIDEAVSVPVSFHQQRLWFIDKFERDVLYDGSPTYHNVPLILELDGHLDRDRLQKAFDSVVDRQPILRAQFTEHEDSLEQSGYSTSKVIIEYEDLSDDSDSGQCFRQRLLESSRINFHFEGNVCVRATLFRLGEARHTLLVTLHHLIADRASTQILFDQLVSAYKTDDCAKPSNSGPKSCRYNQLATLQSKHTESRFKEHFLHWQRTLKGNVKALELRTDRPRKAIHEYIAETSILRLSEKATSMMSAWCETYELSERDFLLAAFKSLLFKYAGHEEIVVGIVAENRPGEQFEQEIGPYSNLLVTRDWLGSDTQFHAVVEQVSATCKKAEQYAYIPFDWLVKKLALKVDMSRTALFDVLFHYDPDTKNGRRCEKTGLSFTRQENNLGFGKYDLNLLATHHQAQLEFHLCFNRDLFDQATAQAMLAHLSKLIEHVLSTPSACLRDINMVSDTEILQQSKFGSALESYDVSSTIHERFELQVERSPDSIAVVYDDQHVTYSQLNQRANQIANFLRSRGVVGDSLVGLCLERSVDMIAGLLGVLKAGGAYVPIDTSYPDSRIGYILQDSRLSLVITEQSMAARWAEWPDREYLYVDADCSSAGDQGVISSQNNQNIVINDVGVSPTNLAYVIYTSGSTGTPKGVLIEHKNVIRLFDATEKHFQFSNSDTWTLFHSIAFDFSVWEVWGALLFGGRLIVVPKLVAQSPADFYHLVANESVTVLNQTPSVFNQVIEIDGQANRELSLRTVIFGGEALEPQTLSPWVQRHGDQTTHLVNMYGITETTVHVTYRRLFADDITGIKPSVIGKPISDLSMYLLDENHTFVPRGVVAEIYVGGSGLARGYQNLPELTEERFITVQLGDGQRRRLYKTGDLARWQGDGNLEYIGRADDQVKIRGFRIELGEIEAQITGHCAIKSCVVVVRKTASDDRQLVAYVVPHKQVEEDIAQALRLYLHAQLPEYMIPDAYVVLSDLPLTTNGKVDRKRLPEPDIAAYATEEYVAASNDTERRLVSIWARLLNHDESELSVVSNFFMLGGHSLIATRLFSDIRHEFGVDLPLRSLFEAPTVEGLAATLDQNTQSSQLPELTKAPADVTQELSFAQQRLWFIDQFGGGSVEYNAPGKQIVHGDFDPDLFKQAVQRLFDRHEVLRTVYLDTDGVPQQLVLDNYELPVTIIDLSNVSSDKQQQQLLEIQNDEATRAFDLSSDLMLRFQLVKVSKLEHHIFHTFHHIACDGWSLDIFNRELSALYRSYASDTPALLPDLALQYSDFAVWQRSWLQGDLLSEQTEYWRNVLSSAPLMHSLPLDRPRPDEARYHGKAFQKSLTSSQDRAVKAYCDSHDITPFIFYYSVFALLMCRLSNTEDIVIGTPTSGRGHKDIEDMIGLFVNTLALRSKVDRQMSLQDFIEANRHHILDCFQYQDLPFDLLVDEVCSERALNHAPIFQIMFAMQNNTHGCLQLNDTDAEQFDYFASSSEGSPFTDITTRFDLELHLEPKDEGTGCSWIFNTDLFDESTVLTFAECYSTLIDSAIDALSRSTQNSEVGVDEMSQNVLSLSISRFDNSLSAITDVCSQGHDSLLSSVSHLETNLSMQPNEATANTKLVVLNEAFQLQPKGVAGRVWRVAESMDLKSLRTGDLAIGTGGIELYGRISHQDRLLLEYDDQYSRTVANQFRMRIVKDIIAQVAGPNSFHVESSGESQSSGFTCFLNSTTPESDLQSQQAMTSALIRNIREWDERLPIPQRFLFVEKIPRLSNGEVDHRKLKELMQPKAGIQSREPSNDIERFLCALWAELLDLKTVGVEENFFTLGGHSLLTTRLISAIRTEFEVEISIPEIFENPTIEEIGKLISLQQDALTLSVNQNALQLEHNELEEGIL